MRVNSYTGRVLACRRISPSQLQVAGRIDSYLASEVVVEGQRDYKADIVCVASSKGRKVNAEDANPSIPYTVPSVPQVTAGQCTTVL